MDRYTVVKFHLNQLDGDEVAVLIKELLSAARPHKKLPGGVTRALETLRSAGATLGAANTGGKVRSRQRSPGGAERIAADRAEDRAFRALHDLLQTWSMNDGDPRARDRAAQMLELLFPDGLAFTRMSWRAEWNQAERLIGRIAEHQLAPEIAAIGGASFLARIGVVHAHYGQALGITAAKPEGAVAAPTVGAALRIARAAVRSYQRKIEAHVESNDGDHAATTLAASLLEPLRRPPAASRSTAAPPTAPASKSLAV